MIKFSLIALAMLCASVFAVNAQSQQSNGTKQKLSQTAQKMVDETIAELVKIHGAGSKAKLERSIPQAAILWNTTDGSAEDFKNFCKNYFVSDPAKLEALLGRLNANYESLYGHFNKMNLDLKEQMQMDKGELMPIDMLFGEYDPSAHLMDDMYNSKIAFAVIINFPYYSLEEKTKYGAAWSRKEWSFARIGDMFISRVPAELYQNVSQAITKSDAYISEYNIFMAKLISDKGGNYFPEGMKLISHWNLRDELKSQYAKKDEGFERQKMIYQVMQRIINQDIPEIVINNDKVTWNPVSNKVFENGKEINAKSEPNTRYAYLLSNFKAMSAMDNNYPTLPTYIARKFDLERELKKETIENLFRDLMSSKEVKEVANLIKKRLGRKLQPFDIWYDGFKTRSAYPQEQLDKMTKERFPNTMAFQKDIPNILVTLGFDKKKAEEIASKIQVDASRGAGHAAGAQMKSEKARLRTRIPADGMNYKGFNIAVHELGHNVEQTLTLNDVDYYALTGVPNTSFTENFAFLFQARDLEILGLKNNDPNKIHLDALDNFWATMEIMGVSLVDIKVWEWLYANPNATPEQLKQAVVSSAKEVWNEYFAPAFEIKDAPILAIYSHMIDNPLYLADYPMGHLIHYQIEKYIEGKNLANEMIRMCVQGRTTPQIWMKNAVGTEISAQPLVQAASEALKHIK